MSNSVFPILPGLEWKYKRIIVAPPVKILTTPSQREFRARDATLPRYRYVFSYEFLRQAAALAEWQTLEDFFKTHGGDFESFRLTDPDDNTVTAGLFGTGNGSTTQFQLVRTLSSFAEGVYELNGTPQIFKNGVLQSTPSQYSITATGVVVFVTAPAAGQALTWTGSYYRRARFARGEMEFSKLWQDFWEGKKVELISIKPGSQ